jgi:hypothetical protein
MFVYMHNHMRRVNIDYYKKIRGSAIDKQANIARMIIYSKIVVHLILLLLS